MARADGSPIVAGTVNWYAKNISGANAGKWWRDSDQTWQVIETANAMTHVSDGHWTRTLAGSPWTDGDLTLEYAKESTNLHVPCSRMLKVEYTPTADASRRVDIGKILGTASAGAAGSVRADSVTGAVGSVTGAVGSVTGNVGGNVTGTVASVVGNVGGNVSGNVSGSVGSVTGAVGSVTGAVGSVTGLTASTIAAAILAASVESGVSLAQILEAIGAATAGNYDPATGTFKAVGNGSTTRLTTVLAGGARTNTPSL